MSSQWSLTGHVNDHQDWKALLNGHKDCQYLGMTTTFTNFNSFPTSSKTILASPCNRQLKQTNSTKITFAKAIRNINSLTSKKSAT